MNSMFSNFLDKTGRKLRHYRRDQIEYRIDDILKIENPEKAYWALHDAIMKDKYRDALPVELRILSLADFTGNCLTNGFLTFDRKVEKMDFARVKTANDLVFNAVNEINAAN